MDNLNISQRKPKAYSKPGNKKGKTIKTTKKNVLQLLRCQSPPRRRKQMKISYLRFVVFGFYELFWILCPNCEICQFMYVCM